MPNWLDVIIRSIGAFVLLLFMARILGKQTISRMNYFDFVAAITLGGMAANMTFDVRLPAWDNVIAIIVFSMVALLASYTVMKSRKLRKWIAGEATVLIENGQILEGNMRKIRYTLDNLNHHLRLNNIYSPADVEFAILETNGELSIHKKPKSAAKKELPIYVNDIVNQSKIPIEIIMDGKLVEENLQKNHIPEEWVDYQLTIRGYKREDTNYMVLGSDRRIYIDTYNDHLKMPRDY